MQSFIIKDIEVGAEVMVFFNQRTIHIPIAGVNAFFFVIRDVSLNYHAFPSASCRGATMTVVPVC